MTTKEYNELSKRYQKTLSKIEKKGYKLFYTALKQSTEKVMPYLDIYGYNSLLFSLNSLVDSDVIKDAYNRFYKAAISIALVDNTKTLIKSVEGSLTKSDVIDTLNIGFRNEEIIKQIADLAEEMSLAENVVNVTQYTKELIRDTINKGLRDNLTTEQIAKKIKGVTQGRISKMRALRIARTETTHASSKSAKILSDQIPFEQNKIWIPRLDGRERPEHGAMLGMKPIPKKDLFTVGGEKLEYPGDSLHGASASMTINCRCVAHYIPIDPKEEETIFDTPQPKKTIIGTLKSFLRGLLTAELFSF